MTQQPEFGRRLRELRRERRLSQRQLAGDMITPSYVSLLESGDRVPTLDVALSLATTLGVPVRDLIGNDVALGAAVDHGDGADLVTDAVSLSAIDERDYPSAADTLREALASAVRDGNTDRRLVLGMRLQYVLNALGHHDERVALLADLVALPAPPHGAGELPVVLRTDLAAALRAAGRPAEARTAAAEASELIAHTALRDTGQHVKLLAVLVSILVDLGDVDQVDRQVAALLVLADRAGSSGLTGRAHWVAAVAYAHLGRKDAAREQLQLAQTHLASPNLPLIDWLRFSRTGAAILLDNGGPLDEVRTWLATADNVARLLRLETERRLVAAVRANCELAAGDPELARRLTDELLADPAGLSPADLLAVRLVRAQAALALGDPAADPDLRQLAIEHEEAGLLPAAIAIWRRLDRLRTAPDHAG